MKKLIAIIAVTLMVFSLMTTAFAASDKVLDAKSKSLQARERYLEIKQNFLQLRQAYLEKKEALLQLRQKFINATNEEKVQMRVQLRERAIEILKHQVQVILNRLEAFEEKGIAPDTIAEIKQKFLDLQAQLEAGNLTDQEIINVAKQVRDHYKNLSVGSMLKAAKSLDNKIKAYLNKAETAYERASALISRLKDKGFDTTSMEAKLAEYRSKINEARQLYEEAKQQWQNAETAQDKLQVLKDAQATVKEIHKNLVDAFLDLKEVIRAIMASYNQEQAANENTNSTES